MWIAAIKKHQNFTQVDEHTTCYMICHLHFDPILIKPQRKYMKFVDSSVPTRFPDSTYRTPEQSDDVFTDPEIPMEFGWTDSVGNKCENRDGSKLVQFCYRYFDIALYVDLCGSMYICVYMRATIYNAN